MPQPEAPSEDEVAAWFRRQLPDDWFDDVRVLVDRDEVLVIGTLPAPEGGEAGAVDEGEADDGARDVAEQERIVAFRESTRAERVAIARRAEARLDRKVSWAAECGRTRITFTHLTVPVMTRLRMGERRLLDTLVAAGVARSRSDALGWCVRLVAEHEGEWLAELREALEAVERVKARRLG